MEYMQQELFGQRFNEYKKAIIIGATSDIGRALAGTLVSGGYRVGITGRRAELLEEIQRTHPNMIICRSLDVTDLSKTAKSLESLIRELGGLDLLVLSAGAGFINEDLDISPQLETIATNVTAFTDIMSFGFKYFARKKSGHLVGITSLAAMTGSMVSTAYNASRAYQGNYLNGLQKKARSLDFPLHVTDIRPGFVKAGMSRGNILFRAVSPEIAAEQILRAIKKKKKISYITRRWHLLSLIMRWFPHRLAG